MIPAWLRGSGVLPHKSKSSEVVRVLLNQQRAATFEQLTVQVKLLPSPLMASPALASLTLSPPALRAIGLGVWHLHAMQLHAAGARDTALTGASARPDSCEETAPPPSTGNCLWKAASASQWAWDMSLSLGAHHILAASGGAKQSSHSPARRPQAVEKHHEECGISGNGQSARKWNMSGRLLASTLHCLAEKLCGFLGGSGPRKSAASRTGCWLAGKLEGSSVQVEAVMELHHLDDTDACLSWTWGQWRTKTRSYGGHGAQAGPEYPPVVRGNLDPWAQPAELSADISRSSGVYIIGEISVASTRIALQSGSWVVELGR